MDSNAKKRKFHYQANTHQPNRSKYKDFLVAGLRGFLCTCNFREKDCVREAYNLLNEYADCIKDSEKVTPELNIPEAEKGETSTESDIQDELSKELESLKSGKTAVAHQKKFQLVDSGAKNCLFIRTTLQDPVKLVHNILEDLDATKKPKSRFLIRLLPVEATCKAYMEDIKSTADQLFEKYFKAGGKTFSIVFNARYNHNVTRDKVIDELAQQIVAKNAENRVDLKQPDLAVLVEIIRNMCCISVLPNYYKFRKYNLLEVSGATEVKAPQQATGDGISTVSPTEDDGTSKESSVEPKEPLKKQIESGDGDTPS